MRSAAAANGTAPVGYANNGTKLIKKFVYPWAGKGERGIGSSGIFIFLLYAICKRTKGGMGPWIHWCSRADTTTTSNGTPEKEIVYS